MPAGEAIATVDSGDLFMLPPTYLTCLEIARYADPGATLVAADGRVVDMFMPEVVDQDEAVLSIPERCEDMLAEHRARRG
jgi:hypothetical protein